MTHGEEFQRILDVVKPSPDWRVLDVAAEAGRLKFTLRDFSSVIGGDAEKLPFADSSFDLVTCRAARYFADVYRFAVEARRVLKHGGVLAVYDDLLPEEKRAGEYLNAFERLREPNFVCAYSESEWRSTFLDADFTVEDVEHMARRVNLEMWAGGCSAYVIERLQILLAQAPQAVAAWLHPTCVGTRDASFEQKLMIITGKKN